MSRGKQSVKKGVWYIGGKKKKKRKQQRGKGIRLEVIASVAGPILSEVAKPIFKKIFGRGKSRRKIKRW